MQSPLANWRVVVTRAATSGDRLGDALRAYGAQPIVVASIHIEHTQDGDAVRQAIAEIATYDWMLVTSSNTVDALKAHLSSHEAHAIAWPRAVAVGPETARAVQMLGATDVATPRTFLASEIPNVLGDVRGARIWWPHGAEADDDMARTLRERGAYVDELVVYHTVPTATCAEIDAVFAAGVDAITFASGTAVDAVCDALADKAIQQLGASVVACIGPRTAEVAKRRGVRVNVVAVQHTLQGLADALAEYASMHPLNASRTTIA